MEKIEILNEEEFKRKTFFGDMGFLDQNDNLVGASDIDGAFEWHDKIFIFFETKHKSVEQLSKGQKKMYERIVERLASTGVLAAVALCDTYIDPDNGYIWLSKSNVRQYKSGSKPWAYPSRPTTALEFRDLAIKEVDYAQWRKIIDDRESGKLDGRTGVPCKLQS